MEGQNSSWLKVSKLSKDVWRIEDGGIVSQYLIAGDNKALLIDCGWGIGDLREVVDGLTSLPLTVINTHGHPDHTCGNFRFEGIHIHEGDVPMLKKNFSPAVRYQVLKRFPKHTLPAGFSEDAWLHARLSRFTPFKGPLSFDLGGRTVDVIETPGHTPGSICLYDSKERLLFSADNILENNTLLMLEDSLPLKTYMRSIDKLATMMGQVDKIYPAHGKAPLKPRVLAEMQDGVRKIIKGELKGHPETTRLGSGLSCHFDTCGILYDEKKLK